MKTLNFAPCYVPYLLSGQKRTTLRLANRKQLEPGEEVELTAGWEGEQRRPLRRARIRGVERKPIGTLTADELQGESPDCADPEGAKLVLSCLYRRVLQDSDPVFVIQLDYS